MSSKSTKAKKVTESILSEEIIQIIRVTPEQTAKALSLLGYEIIPRPTEVPNKIPRNSLWCCYCGDFKKFGKSKKTPHLDYSRCESCNISVEDFYIKTQNYLWETNKRGND